MATTVQPFVGTCTSSIGPIRASSSAVSHQQISMFRASFGEVDLTVAAQNGTIVIEGSARVESISIGAPAEFREQFSSRRRLLRRRRTPAHRLPAPRTSTCARTERRPSPASSRSAGQQARSAHTASIRARQGWIPSAGRGARGLELRATIDRRAWDLSWQLPLPDGRDALGWEVELTAHLELVERY